MPTICLSRERIDPSWQDVKDALKAAVTKAPKGTWIDGSIGQTVLENSQATRAVLDALAPDHPVVFQMWTGHTALLNTAAMRQLGVREDGRDIALEYDANIAPAQGLSSGGKITLRPDLPPAEHFSVLVHEVAHELLHRGDRRKATRGFW